MRYILNLLILAVLLAVVACSGSKHDAEKDNATKEFYAAIQAKKQKVALQLADSLEKAGAVTAARADWMRGTAYDMKEKRIAELFFKKSYDALKDNPSQDWDTYVRTGYGLAALRGLRCDIEASLAVATEMAKVMEQNSDFPASGRSAVLMQIAECQGALFQTEDAKKTYLQAYQALCEACGGEGSGDLNLVILGGNIFTYLLEQGDYDEASSWLERCKEQFAVYEQKGDSALIEEYKGHLALKQAKLLQATGHEREAAATYDAIPRSRFVNPFVIDQAFEYLMAAGRYAEAAECYEQLDSTYVGDNCVRMDFDNICYRLTPRYMANYKAGRTDKALRLGADICQSIDSALVWQKKNDAAELAVIYKTHEQELALEKSMEEARVHRVLLVSAIVIILLISYLLYRSYKYNKVLAAKNRKLYEEIEQREQEQQQVIKQMEETPESSLNANQQIYCRLCEIMKNPEVFAEPDTNQDTLASIIGTNRTYVYDAIRECANQTPADFINGYRLRYAAHLLATTTNSVALIAELCGLSRRTFYRLFNDTYSMSPSDYRQVSIKAQKSE